MSGPPELTYSRWTLAATDDDVAATGDHIRAHLSAITSPADDPTAHADEVIVTAVAADGGLLLTGTLRRYPTAPYLTPDWTPDGQEEQR